MSGELVAYDEMCRAIDAAYRVDEVKDLRDKAQALEAYARQAKNVEAERRACEIRLRAERKVGQLLKEMAKSGERSSQGGDRKSKSPDATLKLADLGVSKGQSSRWQRLADLPPSEFEKAIAAADKPTTSGLIAKPAPVVQPVDRAALWLWGRLHDFERDYLDRDPNDLLRTMTPEMLDDVRRAAPLVAAWLQRMEAFDGKTQAAA